MHYAEEIGRFVPQGEQEACDREVILSYVRRHSHNVLLRDNPIAHITSSGFVVNASRDRALLVRHDIRGVWAWTGGHADGDGDLLRVALREAAEETGLTSVRPLDRAIASLDIFPVFAHRRRGAFVGAHLHLSVAYLLLGDEREPVRPRPGENSEVAWFPVDYFTEAHFDRHDVSLYNKLIRRACAR